MFTLSYPLPARGADAVETYATRTEAERAADDARAALIACGYGAHLDGVRIVETADGVVAETYARNMYSDGAHDGARVTYPAGARMAVLERAAADALGGPVIYLHTIDGAAYFLADSTVSPAGDFPCCERGEHTTTGAGA